MIPVSDAWKDIHQRLILPEGHIEITCEISEVGLQSLATASGTNEAVFSDVSKVADGGGTSPKYATNELNMWALDGSMTVLPDSDYETAGYVSDISESGSVTFTLPSVRTVAIPGVTITWSSVYGEYPPVFTVTAKNGDTVVAELTVTDNTEKTCVVDLELVNYDSVTVTVQNWCLPYRRARIESISLGHTLTLTKNDILGYTHENHGDILSGELPKNSIEFSLNNIDGRWNPNNPSGMEKYLSERQKLTVRYGFTMDDGTVEWVQAGVFYLTEWNAPSNGLEARFAARDIFTYLENAYLSGEVTYGTALDELLLGVFSHEGLPEDFTYSIDSEALKVNKAGEWYVDKNIEEYTLAEIIQLCANASALVTYQDRYGVLHVDQFNTSPSDYMIPKSLSYSHPEIELSKPLKKVVVAVDVDDYELEVGSTGEEQVIINPFISDYYTGAAKVAELNALVLSTRKKVIGDFRGDPRLELFDVVVVESKYGNLFPVAITNIKYSFNGSFNATYEGRVLAIDQPLIGAFIIGESVLGEVV